MNTNYEEKCQTIALIWFEGIYTQEQAEVSCAIQGLDFKNVEIQYGYLYEKTQILGELWKAN